MEKNRSIHEVPDARGMIPIEKNIIVSDVNGRRIGATYPKRAAGLVKSGRAERISDHEIRLKITQSLTVSIDTEEENMSKVIHFILLATQTLDLEALSRRRLAMKRFGRLETGTGIGPRFVPT